MLTCQEVVTEDGCRTIEARMSGGSPTYYYKYNNPNNLNTQYEADGLRVIRVRYPISNYTYKFSVWDGEETPNSQTPILECEYTLSASSNDLCTIDPDGSGGSIETFPLYILGKKKEFNAQKDLRVELCHNFQYIDYEGNYKALIKYKIYVGKKLIKTYSLPCIYVKELKEWRMELLIGLAGNDFAEFITSLKSTPFGCLLGDESLTVVSFVEKIKQEVWQNNGFNYDSFRYDFIEKWKEENNTAKLDLFFEREIGWIEGNTLGFKKGTIFEMDNEE